MVGVHLGCLLLGSLLTSSEHLKWGSGIIKEFANLFEILNLRKGIGDGNGGKQLSWILCGSVDLSAERVTNSCKELFVPGISPELGDIFLTVKPQESGILGANRLKLFLEGLHLLVHLKLRGKVLPKLVGSSPPSTFFLLNLESKGERHRCVMDSLHIRAACNAPGI